MILIKGTCNQIRFIARVTAGCCIAGMLLSYKLWLAQRWFSASPVFCNLPALAPPFDVVLFIFTLVSLGCIMILRNPRRFIIAFVVMAVVLALLDQNRWQPWFYQYLLMFFALTTFDFRCDDHKHQQAILSLFRIMIAAVYFWSGLQKLNPNFLADTFPWIMEPITQHLGENSISHFSAFGKAFPLIEILTGIFLLVPYTRRPAAVLAILMHLFILLILGWWGHNYNHVVWPWNVAMILYNLVLFYQDQESPVLVRKMLKYHSLKLVTILFVLMPLFNFFGYWDSYLSHNLYSGNTSNGSVYVSESVKNKLPDPIKKYAMGDSIQYQINIKYWCMMELGVPAYPEKRNFESVTSGLYKYAADSSEIYFLYTPKRNLK